MPMRLTESCACGGDFTIEDVTMPTARKLRDEWRELHAHHLAETVHPPRRPTFGEALLGAAATASRNRPGDLATGGVIKSYGVHLDREAGQVPGQLDLIDDGNAAAVADVLDDAADVPTPPMAGPDGELPDGVQGEGFDGLVPGTPALASAVSHCGACGHELTQHGMAGCHAVDIPTGTVCECRVIVDGQQLGNAS